MNLCLSEAQAPGSGQDEILRDKVVNKNGQIAHRRIVPGREILRNHGRNNNALGTGR